MGVYIKGMSKPKGCKGCKFCIVEAKVKGEIYPLIAYCFVQHQNLIDFDDCPLIDLVRCGECIHRHEHEWYNTCDKHIGHGFGDDYFCGDGERRADEGDNL